MKPINFQKVAKELKELKFLEKGIEDVYYRVENSYYSDFIRNFGGFETSDFSGYKEKRAEYEIEINRPDTEKKQIIVKGASLPTLRVFIYFLLSERFSIGEVKEYTREQIKSLDFRKDIEMQREDLPILEIYFTEIRNQIKMNIAKQVKLRFELTLKEVNEELKKTESILKEGNRTEFFETKNNKVVLHKLYTNPAEFVKVYSDNIYTALRNFLKDNIIEL